MMTFKQPASVYLHAAPIDFRKQINGLSLIVQDAMILDVFSSSLFVFVNRQHTRIKILYWDKNGFCLCDRQGWWEVEQRRSSCRAKAA